MTAGFPPPDRGRDRDDDDDDDPGRDPKRRRTGDDESSQPITDSSSDSDESDESNGDPVEAPVAQDPMAVWVGQCFESGYTPQQILDAARSSWGQEAADTHIALHNVRLLAGYDAQEQQQHVGADPLVIQLDLDSDEDEVDWENPLPGSVAEGPVQYEPVGYDEWQQLEQAGGTAVFANTVAAPFDVFADVTDIPHEDCTLCQDPLVDPVVRSTRCQHHFHRHCIVEMTEHATVWQCPLCRTSWA